MSKKYTKEFLINEFWRFYRENGRYPRSTEMKAKNGYPSADAYKNHWDTWNNFLKDIDVLGDNGWYKCDEQVLIDMYENSPKEDIMNALMVKRTWNCIKIKASQMNLSRRQYAYEELRMSKEFLINELKRFYNKYSKVPTCNEIDADKDFPSSAIFFERFGSWNNALKVAGFKVNLIKNHNKDIIMRDVKKFYELHKRSPYYNEVNYSQTIIRQYWKSWNDLLQECGLPITLRDHGLKTKEDGIKFLQDLSKKLNKVPTGGDVERNSDVNRNWFRIKFGSFNKALFEAGLINEMPITNEERLSISIKNLVELSEKLGRWPTVEEYDANKGRGLHRRNLENRLGMKWIDICTKYLPQDKGKIYDKLGNFCYSIPEQTISNFLIDNGIKFQKEYSYSNIFKNDERRFDWVFDINGKRYYVEYFGLYREGVSSIYKNYKKKTRKKIKDLYKAGLIDQCIFIFPWDLENRSLEDIFEPILQLKNIA